MSDISITHQLDENEVEEEEEEEVEEDEDEEEEEEEEENEWDDNDEDDEAEEGEEEYHEDLSDEEAHFSPVTPRGDRNGRNTGSGDDSGEEGGCSRALRWSQRMCSSSQTPRTETDRLVMQYLVMGGFREAVQEFSREAGLCADVAGMEGREEARNLLLRGDVCGCVRLLDDLDPLILQRDATLLFDLRCQHFTELLVVGAAEEKTETTVGGSIEAIQFAQDQLMPLALLDPEGGQGRLQRVERLVALLAFCSPGTLQQLRDPPSAAALPPHLCFLNEALDRRRRHELAARVNQALLLQAGGGGGDVGTSCQTQLAGVLRNVAHLQKRRQGGCGEEALLPRCAPVITQLTSSAGLH